MSADDIAKLRALTDPSLDESVATFLLEIGDNSAQAAAALWREQQGYGQTPAPAPAPAPPPAPSPAPPPPPPSAYARHRTSTTVNTSASMDSSSTSGGRRRGKATAIGNILMETSVRREPMMNLGPSMEPGGIVKGRDRGFAKNCQFLDESAFVEPKLFTEQHLLMNSSLDNSQSSFNKSNPMNDNSASSWEHAYGFSTPGAYNETEEGDGYISRERRESAWHSAPAAATAPSAFASGPGPSTLAGTGRRQDRRVSEQNYSSSSKLLANLGGSLRRCATSDSRRPQQPQHHHYNNRHSQPPAAAAAAAYRPPPQQHRQESWTGRSISATKQRNSMMSVYSDISMGESWLGQSSVEDPDFVPPSDDESIGGNSQRSTNGSSNRRRVSDINYASEPMVQPNSIRRANTAEGSSKRRGLLRPGDTGLISPRAKDRTSISSTTSSTYSHLGSNTTQSLLGGGFGDGDDDDGDFDAKEFMDMVMDTSDVQRKTSSSSGGNQKYPPADHSEDAYQNDYSGSSASRRPRLSIASSLNSGSAHRSSLSRGCEPTIPEEMGNHSDNTTEGSYNNYNKPDPPGETIDTPSLHSDYRPNSFPDGSQCPPSPVPDFKPAARERSNSPRRNDNRRGAAVRVERSSSSDDHLHYESQQQTSNSEHSGKERGRTRATQPGVVRVVAQEEERRGEPNSSNSEPNSKVRRAPASHPGAVSVSNNTALITEPTTTTHQTGNSPLASQSTATASEPDAKVRRSPATRPGVISVSQSTPDEPDSQSPTLKAPPPPAVAADVKVRRTRATRPGVLSVSNVPDEPDSQLPALKPAPAASGSDAKVRRSPAIRPGAVSVSPTPDEPDSQPPSLKPAPPTPDASGSDVKVRRAPARKPGAISVSNTAPDEPSVSDVSQPSEIGLPSSVRRGRHGLRTSQQDIANVTNSIDEALREEKEKEKAGKSLKFFANKPGAVSVSAAEPTVSEATSGQDVKVRRAPASKPGAVSVTSSAPDEPSVSGVSDSISAQDHKDSKVRRTQAREPGAVSVSPEEPLIDRACLDASQQSATEQHNATINVPSGRKGRHGLRTSQLDVTKSIDAALREEKEKEKAGKSLKFFANKPAAVSVTAPAPTVSEAISGSDAKVRRAPASRPGAVSVLNTTSDEPSVSEHPDSGKVQDSKDSKVRRSQASVPGAVCVSPLEPVIDLGCLDSSQQNANGPHQATISVPSERKGSPGLRTSQQGDTNVTNSIDAALREEKEREKAGKSLKFFAKKPGAVSITTEDDRGVIKVTNSTDTEMRDQKEKEKQGLKRATIPGVVHVTGADKAEAQKDSKVGKGLRSSANKPGAVGVTKSDDDSSGGVIKVTNSTDTEMRDQKEKEKLGLGRKKATTPGVVHVTGSDKAGNEKTSKAGKGRKLFPTKPGAVSVMSSDEDSNKKKLRHTESSLTSSEAGDHLEDMTANGDDNDPTMETPEDDQTEAGEEESLPSRNDGKRSPVRLAGGGGGDRSRSRSPPKVMSDPPRGFPTMAPPIKDRRSSDQKAKNRKSIFGMFKKKGKKKSANAKANEDLQAFEEEKLARMGNSRAYPLASRTHR